MQHQLIGHDAAKPPVTLREMRTSRTSDQRKLFSDLLQTVRTRLAPLIKFQYYLTSYLVLIGGCSQFPYGQMNFSSAAN